MARKAPVCHIAPPVPLGDPQPVDAEFLPEARDLSSLIALANALRRIALRGRGGFGGAGHGGAAKPLPPGGTGGTTKDEKKKQGRWTEQSRKTETVKVTNKDDPSVFVEIERINQIIWKDSVTGETFLWERTK